MIIDTMKLHNIGVYKGTHSFDLMPVSGSKKVTLIGGLNGTGKTSFLDAIQIGLFGISGFPQLTAKEYSQKLASLISHDKSTASIEITFREFSEGRENKYRLFRTFKLISNSVKEKVLIHKNQFLDNFSSENWHQCLDRIFPPKLRSLFIFDGEKVSEYSSQNSLSKFIENSVHRCFGIDAIDQLKRDLEIYRKRKQVDLEETPEVLHLKNLENEIERQSKEISRLRNECANIQSNKVDKIYFELKEAEDIYEAAGGKYLDNKASIIANLEKITEETIELEKSLVSLASAELPFLLIKNVLQRTYRRAKQELDQEEDLRRDTIHKNRDEQVLLLLRDLEVADGIITQVKTKLSKEYIQNEVGEMSGQALKLERSSIQKLEQLLEQSLQQTEATARKLLSEIKSQRDKHNTAQSERYSIPEEDSISDLLMQRNAVEKRYKICLEELKSCEEKIKNESSNLNVLKDKLQERLRKNAELEHQNIDDKRVLKHVQLVDGSLDVLRVSLIAGGIEKVEVELKKCLTRLAHSSLHIESAKIDPKSFELTLQSQKGKRINIDTLSAGQKQLVSLATMWAFKAISTWLLPMVIDTPLSRLDAEHRQKFLDCYIPSIAHQVIILSTDKEIDVASLKSLKEWLARTYTLKFTNKTQTTRVEKGYFGVKEVDHDNT